MISDELGKQLHDRATRGNRLSAQERQQLEDWYAAQDNIESQILNRPETTTTSSRALLTQINAIMQQIKAVTQSIQEITQENATLRREVAVLHQQLSQQVSIFLQTT